MSLFNSLHRFRISQGWSDRHAAIDLATPINMVWRAPAAGTYYRLPDELSRTDPTAAGRHGRFVFDDGDEIRGCHLRKHLAAHGERVVKGQALGRTGNTGYVRPRPTLLWPIAGAHFHTYGIRRRTGARFNWLTGTARAAVGVVDTDGGTLRLRSKPSTKGKILADLSDGTKVTAIGFNGKWWKVRHNGKVGWIHAGFVK